MSHLSLGLISAYNSLTDKHLAGYFSNIRIRTHLQRAGLITRSGRIVSDKEYRHKLIQRAHQRHVRECLAQAIFQKVLEMERIHQIEIKRKLEQFAKRERVHKIKLERTKRCYDDIHILSPRPPTGVRKQHSGPEADHSESSESPGSSRPNTAPGKMQRPMRLKPIHTNVTGAFLRRSSPHRLHESSNGNSQPFNCTMEKEPRRRFTTRGATYGISPYCLPVINSFVTPVPPATKRAERGEKATLCTTLRGRRLRPTASDLNEPPVLRSSTYQSRVRVTMVYFGKTVHLSHDLTDMRDEVKVFQQHCGGENLCVYKGRLHEGEMFRFISRRHGGFPFSLTFFLNGLQVQRLSSCCEFKHRKGSRLGGRHGHFGFTSMEDASPCYKCIIALGLDKKPTPPPKRVKGDRGEEETVHSPQDASRMETEMTGVDDASPSEGETSYPPDTEIPPQEGTAPKENKLQDDYDEDFEADDEGAADDAEPPEKTSLFPSCETEKVEGRGISESDDNKEDCDLKPCSSSSSSSRDSEESDTEADQESREDEEQPEKAIQEGTADQLEETEELKLDDTAGAVTENAVIVDSDQQDSAAASTVIEVANTSAPSGNESKQAEDAPRDKGDECQREEEQERTKFVQEMLAEAMQKGTLCSSEPELSDTSTEVEEECTSKDAAPDVQEDDNTDGLKELKDETEEKSHENPMDATVKEEDKDTAEQDESQGASAGPDPQSVDKMDEDDKTAKLQEVAAKATDAESAEKDEESEAQTAEEGNTQAVQGAESFEKDESSLSELKKKSDEAAELDNAEAMTPCQTLEMRDELSEEREALSCEETLVTGTERQSEDVKDMATGAETEVKAGNSGGWFEGSGDNALLHKPTEDNEMDDRKDESGRNVEERETGETVIAEAGGGDGGKQVCERGEKTTNIPEKKTCEGDGKEDETQTDPGQTSCENTEEKEKHETEIDEKQMCDVAAETEGCQGTDNMIDKEKCEGASKAEEEQTNTEEIRDKTNEGKEMVETDEADRDMNGESKAEEIINIEENITEGSQDNTNREDVEQTKIANKEVVVENMEKGEGNSVDGVGINNDRGESGEINKTNMDSVNKKGDEAEETKKCENDNEAEEKESVMEEEIGKTSNKDLNKDEMGILNTNIESQDLRDHEGANADLEGKITQVAFNKVIESENMFKESDQKSDNGERCGINPESGESKTHDRKVEDEAGDGEVTEPTYEKRNTELSEENESAAEQKEGAESEDMAEKRVDGSTEQAPVAEPVESDAAEGEGTTGKENRSEIKDFEQDESGTDTKGEPNSDDRNTYRNQSKHEKREENIHRAIVSEVAEKLTSLDDLAHRSDNEEVGKHSNEAAVGAAIHEAIGDKAAEMEEARKALEEGVSVLLKPRAPLKFRDEENAEEAIQKDTTATLEEENSADLVTNWVTMHQASKYFETFVEPLEDLRDSISDAQAPKTGETPSQELLRSASPFEMMRMFGRGGSDEEKESKSIVDAAESDAVTVTGDEPCEREPGKDLLQVKEVKHFIPNTEKELDPITNLRKEYTALEEITGNTAAFTKPAYKVEPAGEKINLTDIFKMEIQSNVGTNQGEAKGKPESATGNQSEDRSDRHDEKAPGEEKEDVSLPTTNEIKHSDDSAGVNIDEWMSTERKDEKGQEVTQVNDLTKSKSDVGSQEDLHSRETKPKPSDGSTSGDRRDALIHDIKHSLSKDRLSNFPVDESLFGRSS